MCASERSNLSKALDSNCGGGPDHALFLPDVFICNKRDYAKKKTASMCTHHGRPTHTISFLEGQDIAIVGERDNPLGGDLVSLSVETS